MQLQQQERTHSSPSSSRPSSSSLPRSTPRPLPPPPNPHSSPHFSHSFRSLTSPPLPLASPPPRPTSYSTTLQIYRTEGIRGFYKGLSASLLGVTEGTIQWSLYEQFKKIAKAEQIKSNGASGGDATEGWRVSMAAGMAKLVATVITYPHEVRFPPLLSPLSHDALTKFLVSAGDSYTIETTSSSIRNPQIYFSSSIVQPDPKGRILESFVWRDESSFIEGRS